MFMPGAHCLWSLISKAALRGQHHTGESVTCQCRWMTGLPSCPQEDPAVLGREPGLRCPAGLRYKQSVASLAWAPTSMRCKHCYGSCKAPFEAQSNMNLNLIKTQIYVHCASGKKGRMTFSSNTILGPITQIWLSEEPELSCVFRLNGTQWWPPSASC